MIEEMNKTIDIPIIATVVTSGDNYKAKIEAGARVLNVSGGANTVKIVKQIRSELGREFPIIATGGPTDETILETIEAGANAITYTPPSSAEIFTQVMKKYRNEL